MAKPLCPNRLKIAPGSPPQHFLHDFIQGSLVHPFIHRAGHEWTTIFFGIRLCSGQVSTLQGD